MVDAVDDTYEGSYIILVWMSLGECVVLILGAQLLEEDALQLLYIGSGELLKVLYLSQCFVVAVLCLVIDYSLLVRSLYNHVDGGFGGGVFVLYVDDELLVLALLLQQVHYFAQFSAHTLQCVKLLVLPELWCLHHSYGVDVCHYSRHRPPPWQGCERWG
mgnify:CR=1 FL=1